jgi:ankyrin repeat protein
MKIASLLCLLGSLLSACAMLPQSAKDRMLVRAAEHGQVSEMQELIKSGADINGHDAEGWTPYLAASTKGQFAAMRLLRGLGARTEAPDLEQLSYERHSQFKE